MSGNINRRGFLKLGAASLAGAVLAGCKNPRRWVVLEPFVQAPEEQVSGEANWYASLCRECPAGCGILVRVMNGRALKIEGNPEHPLNRGKLCARGQAGLQRLYHPDRLAGPVRQSQRGSRDFEAITWQDGVQTLVQKLEAADGALAAWCGSRISGSTYDLFSRLLAHWGGSEPLVYDLYSAFNGYPALSSALSDANPAAGLPGYRMEDADVVYSFGANFLGPWLSAVRYGVEFGGFRGRPLGRRGYLVQFEPRMSISGAKADRWVPLRQGTEPLVAQAMLRLIADQQLGSAERVSAAQALAGEVDVAAVSQASGISPEDLLKLSRIFAEAERSLAIPGPVISGRRDAPEALAAVQALNSLTLAQGQAGLATAPAPLPSGVTAPRHASWQEVSDLLDRMKAGAIQVLLVDEANPLYDLPDSTGIQEALSNVPFIISFASIVDETAAHADLVLPDHTYLEAWGYRLSQPDFGIPVVTSQQPVVQPLYDTRAAGDVLLSAAHSLELADLPWEDEAAYLEHLAGQLGPGMMGGEGAPVLFSRFLQHGGWWPAEGSPSVSTPIPAAPVRVPNWVSDQSEKDGSYHLYLYLSDFLSSGIGAGQPWLQVAPDPMTTIAWQTWVELHPQTAHDLGVTYGDIVKISSSYGEIQAPVYLLPAIRPDTVAIPLGQGHTDLGRYARDRGANAVQLLGSDQTGEPFDWATLRVKITPTGQKVNLATFENTVGVTEGFINQAFPGL